MTPEEYQYLYGQMVDTEKKIPPYIYKKIMEGEEFTKEEEDVVADIVRLDMVQNIV